MNKELSPLKTFELLCRYCVEEINILRHRQIVEDYFYNEKYEVSITDKKTLEKGFTANIEKALKAIEILKESPIFAWYVTIYKDAYEMVADAKGFRVNNSVEELQQMFDLLKEVLLWK